MNASTAKHLAAALLAGLTLLTLSAPPAWALQRGRTLQDRAYASGGVAESEQLELQAERPACSLWIVTAARRSGAYLAEARVSIRDDRRQLVFDGTLDGPWLLIDLAPGRYGIETSWQGQVVRSTTTIRAGEHRQIVAYFVLADEPGPG